MLSRLRLKLTLLYLLISTGFVGLMGAGMYFSLRNSYQTTTDRALKYRLMVELNRLKLPVPAEIANQKYSWAMPQATANPTQTPLVTSNGTGSIENESEEGLPANTPSYSHENEKIEPGDSEVAYEGELAAIFVMAVDSSDKLISEDVSLPPPIEPDAAAIHTAVLKGMDLRTERLADGSTVRLLTYRLTASSGAIALQLGRLTGDQDRALGQYLTGIIVLGGISLVLMGVGSWLLAGRSILPAQKALEQQQAFVANASHELRTPLTLIRGSAELAGREPDAAERNGLLKDVVEDTDYMSRMVEDLLLLSRLDAQKLNLQRAPAALVPIFAEIQRKANLILEPKGIELSTDGAHLSVLGDMERLQQVLWILVDNAASHTPRGGWIRLTAQAAGRKVDIQVNDNGSGIPAVALPRVFERFYKAGGESEDGKRGAGLGLSIAKALVEAMRGRISVESREGEGTRMTVELERA